MVTQKNGSRAVCSAATAGLAVAAAAAVTFLAAQQRRYGELRERLDGLESAGEHHRHAALIQQQRLHFELLSKAMDNPDLAAVLDTYEEELAPGVRRQYLFANAVYTNTLLALRIGIVNREELYGHLRMICRSEAFRDYWDATRHHRASLKSTSDEAELGRLVDGLVQDLNEAETDEWWVLGEPPVD
ncbi:DUF6082 family protein [Streptomyces sp. T-3]|nr:DUF6082 family protein [Streptomyces sp. T-3]